MQFEIPDEFIQRLADAISYRLQVKTALPGKIPLRKWLTHKEAAEYIRKSPAALYKLTCERKVKYSKRGKANIYQQVDLDAYITAGFVKTDEEIKEETKLLFRRKTA